MEIACLIGILVCIVFLILGSGYVIKRQDRRISELERELMNTTREFSMYQSAVRGDLTSARVLSAGARTRIPPFDPTPQSESAPKSSGDEGVTILQEG